MMTEDTQILFETGAKEEIGIVDEPLEKRGEDSLKIKKYSNDMVKLRNLFISLLKSKSI